ncbi:MAG: DUF1828 domain-containing protein [Polyangiaceae bacterium]|jgi:hypothetical protein
MTADPCTEIASQLSALFVCAPHDSRVRVRTPFLYPDGDVIDVYYSEKGGVRTLTDLGETVRWLRTQTLAPRRSPKQRQMIDDVCVQSGVEFFKGMLMLRLRPGDTIAGAVVRIGQACLRVADIWFTLRTRAVETLTDEVADYLSEKLIPFDRAKKLVGRSGRDWSIDFHTRTPDASSLVCVLGTGSRAAARKVAEHVLATWVDLSAFAVGPQPHRFVSLFDDTMDVWQPEDFNLVDSVSDVARWSRPDEFEELVRKAG